MGVHTDPLPALAELDALDTWSCWIPDEPWPGLNLTQMAHWSRVRKHKTAMMKLIVAYGGVLLPRFDGPARVTLTRWLRKRERELDHENLFGGAKPIVDALRRDDGVDRRGRRRGGGLGVIEDDKPRLLELHVIELRDQEGPGGIAINVEGTRE